MQLYLDCMPCLTEQIIALSKRLIDDEVKRYKVVKECFDSVGEYIYKGSCAPIITEKYLDILKNAVGQKDMYQEEKDTFNNEMKKLINDFRDNIQKSDEPIETALILSGAANIIDYGIVQSLDSNFVKAKLAEAVTKVGKKNDVKIFTKELEEAKTLLYIGDNCGEIVLDKLVLEQIKKVHPNIKIYYAVREIPVLNDVTMKEALEVGIDKYAEIISSGSTLPGTVLERCTEEFKKIYKEADVKVLKGMGNVETAKADEKDAYFVFMVKCNHFVRLLDSDMYTILVAKGNPLYA